MKRPNGSRSGLKIRWGFTNDEFYECRTATAMSTAKGQLSLLRLLLREKLTLLFCPHGPLRAGIGTSTHTADIHLHYYFYHYFLVAPFRKPIIVCGWNLLIFTNSRPVTALAVGPTKKLYRT
jgi:hypothetical protein